MIYRNITVSDPAGFASRLERNLQSSILAPQTLNRGRFEKMITTGQTKAGIFRYNKG